MTHELPREPRFPAERLITRFTPQERGLAAAALVAFLGITYLGPALTRLLTPKSRTLREAAEAKARKLRQRAGTAKGRGSSFSRERANGKARVGLRGRASWST